jgi:hypothetical protein
MKYEIKWGEYLKVEIPWQHLHIVYGLMSFLSNFIPKNDQFHHYFKRVEHELRKKIIFQEEAKRFRMCERCFKEIDTSKDKFEHRVFESGYEQFFHQECPAINKGKGYEND